VLVLFTSAVLSGSAGPEDVTAWVHAAPAGALVAAGARRNALGILVAPYPDTVIRALAARSHPGPVAFPLAGPAPLPGIAVDGKFGARRGRGRRHRDRVRRAPHRPQDELMPTSA
jgi:hypothetical protein